MDRGLTDVGLLLEPVDMEKYEFIRLDRAERWIVVMHPGSPLAQKDYITAEDLKEVPLILPRRLNVRSELAHWFGEYYDELNVLFTSNLPSNSAVMAHNRLACAIAIQGSISFWDREKIVCRPLSPELSANSVLAWKRQQPFGLAAARFIEFLKETLEKSFNTML